MTSSSLSSPACLSCWLNSTCVSLSFRCLSILSFSHFVSVSCRLTYRFSTWISNFFFSFSSTALNSNIPSPLSYSAFFSSCFTIVLALYAATVSLSNRLHLSNVEILTFAEYRLNAGAKIKESYSWGDNLYISL